MQTRRFLRLPELMTLTGLRRSAIYSRCADGRLPSPHHLGRASVWLSADIEQWIELVCTNGAEPRPGTYPVHTPEFRSAGGVP